jgi:hypothetical protein
MRGGATSPQQHSPRTRRARCPATADTCVPEDRAGARVQPALACKAAPQCHFWGILVPFLDAMAVRIGGANEKGLAANCRKSLSANEYQRSDSNRHALNGHWILSPARLPIPPLWLKGSVNSSYYPQNAAVCKWRAFFWRAVLGICAVLENAFNTVVRFRFDIRFHVRHRRDRPGPG